MRDPDRPTRNSAVVPRRTEGLLYHSATGELHAVNPSALAIWDACDGATTVAEIAGAVAELSGQDFEMALEQVEQSVVRLRSRGLLD